MSEQSSGLVSADWIEGLVAAAFGGEVPEALAAFVDPDVCATHLGGSKLGVGVSVKGDGPTVLRIARHGEAERIDALAAALDPAAADFIAAHADKNMFFDVSSSGLKVFVTGVEGEVAGQTAVGRIFDGGREGFITMHDSLPSGVLPEALVSAASALASEVEGGTWFAQWFDGAAHSLIYDSEGAWAPELGGTIASFAGAGPLDAVLAHYSGAGLSVDPWFVEFMTDGVMVMAWGAFDRPDTDDLPGIFSEGVPPAEHFAAELARTLPDEGRDDAEGWIRTDLYPTIVGAKPDDVELADHVADAWRWLVEQLSLEAPFDRLEVLKKIAVANRFPSLQAEAFQLAVARYLASHPDTKEAPEALPEALAGLDAEAIQDRARELLTEFEALEAAASADEELDAHRIPGVAYELPIIRDNLERAVSGEFAAGAGPLHDYLVELGTFGYDDDPTVASLEDIDLDADHRDAVIEEALAFDEDDDL